MNTPTKLIAASTALFCFCMGLFLAVAISTKASSGNTVKHFPSKVIHISAGSSGRMYYLCEDGTVHNSYGLLATSGAKND